MTRFLGAVLTLALVAGLSNPCWAADAQDVKAILDKAIKALGGEAKLSQALNEIESMMQDGIIVLSNVDVIRLVHSRPAAEPANANE